MRIDHATKAGYMLASIPARLLTLNTRRPKFAHAVARKVRGTLVIENYHLLAVFI